MIHNIRFEYGSWPIVRIDKSLRYILKSRIHKKKCDSTSDSNHFLAQQEFIKNLKWRDSKQDCDTIRLAAVGDLMWQKGNQENTLAHEVIDRLSRADFCLANLETPVDPYSPVPRLALHRFNSHPNLLQPWRKLMTPTLFSLCNNHALDQGLDGLKRTREYINSIPGFQCLGGSQDNDNIVITKIKSITIATIGMTFGINHFHWRSPKRLNVPGIDSHLFGQPNNPPNWEAIQALINQAKQSKPDLIILMPHWGYEYEYWPTRELREHAYQLIKMGIDIIIGSSPHVLQPLEVVSVNQWNDAAPTKLICEGPPRPGIIAYSLGNFVSSMPTLACQTAGILELEGKKSDGRFVLSNLGFHPTVSLKEKNVLRKRTTCSLNAVTQYGHMPAKYLQHVRTIMG